MSRWPQHKAFAWEYAPFLRALLPFALGIHCYFSSYLTVNGYRSPVLATIAGFAMYAVINLASRTRPALRLLQFGLLQFSLLGAGLSLSALYDSKNDPHWFGKKIEPDNNYVATITGPPAEKDSSWKIPVEVVKMIANGKTNSANGKAFIYVFKDAMPLLYQEGDTILLPGNWQPIKNAGNPFEFDYATYCRLNNICYQQFCNSPQVRLYATVDPDQSSFAQKAHKWCMASLESHVHNRRTMGLLEAMLLGDEVNLDQELRQEFSDTGIVHIIAISGGNIFLLFYFISLLLWWVRHRKYLWLKYLLALPLIWFYVIMAGSSASAMRAAIMFSLLASGILFEKNRHPLNHLLATAFLLLCIQPAWLYALGFQLSFIAVLSLAIFYQPIHNLWQPKLWLARKLWPVACASFAAEILVAPLVIYYFHNFPAMFLAANIIAFAFMGLVLILGIGIVIFSWVPVVADALGWIATISVKFVEAALRILQRLQPISFHFLKLTAPELVCIYLAIGCATYFIFRKNKPALFLALICCCAFTGLLCADKYNNLCTGRFIVYNTAHHNRLEVLMDGRYHNIGNDSLYADKDRYAVDPAHINWQAWRKGDELPELLRVGNKTVLVLNEALADSDHFPVDYLVINYKGDIDPKRLSKTYSPRQIIIGNNHDRRQQQQWADSAARYGVSLHIIGKDGAFVLKR